jgi:hypothetical protein
VSPDFFTASQRQHYITRSKTYIEYLPGEYSWRGEDAGGYNNGSLIAGHQISRARFGNIMKRLPA